MVSACADDPDIDAVSFIPAGVAIDNVNPISCVQVVNSTLPVDTPDLYAKKECQYQAIKGLNAGDKRRRRPSGAFSNSMCQMRGT